MHDRSQLRHKSGGEPKQYATSFSQNYLAEAIGPQGGFFINTSFLPACRLAGKRWCKNDSTKTVANYKKICKHKH